MELIFKPAIVHNHITKVLSGVVQSGFWCILDEVDCVQPTILSVLGSLLHTIRDARNSGCERFLFEGKEISLERKSCFCLITNPG